MSNSAMPRGDERPPDVVVDVGNTRIKWGLCQAGQVTAIAGLPPDDAAAWEDQLQRWQLPLASRWVLTGVHPQRRDTLADWLRQRGEQVRVLVHARELPLRVDLEKPDYVGIDRLLDAVAVNQRRQPGVGAVIIDAGSAVTVDWLDETGAFRGGAIVPGFRLMAKALHDYTALLPLIHPPRREPPVPGPSTPAAMEAGIFWAVAGGIQGLIAAYRRCSPVEPEIHLTGGDGEVLTAVLPGARYWANMTLEGVLLAVGQAFQPDAVAESGWKG